MPTLDTIKSIAGILQKAGKIDEYKQILEWWEKILEMQTKIDGLAAENKTLKESLKWNDKLEFRNNTYWNGIEGPYCSACFDDKKKPIRMTTKSRNHFAECPVCKTRVDMGGNDDSYEIAAQKYINGELT